MKLTLLGRIPSKKNSKQIVPVRGRYIIISSKDYLAWEKAQLWFTKPHLGLFKGKLGLSITCEFYAPDLRASDLSNKFESIADLLVKGGVIDDDNWNVLSNVTLIYKGLDRENPRVLIQLE